MSPDSGGLFARIYELVRRWDGSYPSWFTEWVEAERRAISLHTWEPLLVPGLLQTSDYARALFKAWRSAGSDEELDQLVSARIERQAIFEGSKPPSLWAVIDEGVLTRCIGSAQTMHGQLEHLRSPPCLTTAALSATRRTLGGRSSCSLPRHGGLSLRP